MRFPQELLFYQDLYSESPCQKQKSRTLYFHCFLLKIFKVLAGTFGEVFLFVWRILLWLFVDVFFFDWGFVGFVCVFGFLFCFVLFWIFFLVVFFWVFSSLVVLIILDGEVEYCSDILCTDFQITKLKCVPMVWFLLRMLSGDPQHKYTTNCFITCCSIFRYLHGKDTNCFKQTHVQEAYG